MPVGAFWFNFDSVSPRYVLIRQSTITKLPSCLCELLFDSGVSHISHTSDHILPDTSRVNQSHQNLFVIIVAKMYLICTDFVKMHFQAMHFLVLSFVKLL